VLTKGVFIGMGVIGTSWGLTPTSIYYRFFVRSIVLLCVERHLCIYNITDVIIGEIKVLPIYKL